MTATGERLTPRAGGNIGIPTGGALPDSVVAEAGRMRADRHGFDHIASVLGFANRQRAHSAVQRAVNLGFVNQSDLPGPKVNPKKSIGANPSTSRRPPYVARRGVRSDWAEAASCREVDAELFFPIGANDWQGSKADRERATAAKRICASCPVQRECELLTPPDDDWSIRYGTTPTERRNRRRNRTSA